MNGDWRIRAESVTSTFDIEVEYAECPFKAAAILLVSGLFGRVEVYHRSECVFSLMVARCVRDEILPTLKKLL